MGGGRGGGGGLGFCLAPGEVGGPRGDMGGGHDGVIWAYLRSLLLGMKEWRWRMEQIIAAKPPAGEGGTKGKESKFRRRHGGGGVGGKGVGGKQKKKPQASTDEMC